MRGFSFTARHDSTLSPTVLALEEYTTKVRTEDHLPEVVSFIPSISGHSVCQSKIYSEMCDAEKLAARIVIDAFESGELSSLQIEELFRSLPSAKEDCPSPFKFCCSPHINEELSILEAEGHTQMLFVGGGSFPSTGINAALRGLHVTLVDRDENANSIAAKVIATLSKEVQGRLSLVTADALTLDISRHSIDSVFIAAMVCPKEKVIRHLASQLACRDDCEPRILCRSPRSSTAQLMYENDPEFLPKSSAHLATICSSYLADTRCRIYCAKRIAKMCQSEGCSMGICRFETNLCTPSPEMNSYSVAA